MLIFRGFLPSSTEQIINAFTKKLLLACYVSIILAICGCKKELNFPPPQKKKELPVDIAVARSQEWYTTSGNITSNEKVNISSKLSGYINEITVQEGDSVRKGQTLVFLDDSDIEGAITQAKASVSSASSAYIDAKTDNDKFLNLYKNGTISENEMRKTKLRYDAASETLKQANAALEVAISLKNYAEIKSPIDGIIISKLKKQGDLALPGLPILTVESEKELYLESYVSENFIKFIDVNKPVYVNFYGIENPLTGTVTNIVNSSDLQTRSYYVKIKIPRESGLTPGMYARVRFPADISNTIRIPQKSIVTRSGLDGVFVLDTNNTAHFRWLRFGRTYDDKIEVQAGLEEGDHYISAPTNDLQNGDLIHEIK